MATKKISARKSRNPSSGHNVFVDRGYGIGRHSFNDARIDPNRGGLRSVRQIIVTDTRGDNITEYDLDYRTVRPMSGVGERFRPIWTWAQVESVVNRDLATIGKSFGDSYGAFYDSTTYGLYHGRRPSWYPESDWAKALLAGDRSRRKIAAKTRNPSPKKRVVTASYTVSIFDPEAGSFIRFSRMKGTSARDVERRVMAKWNLDADDVKVTKSATKKRR